MVTSWPELLPRAMSVSVFWLQLESVMVPMTMSYSLNSLTLG